MGKLVAIITGSVLLSTLLVVTVSQISSVTDLEKQIRQFSKQRSHLQPDEKDNVRAYINDFFTLLKKANLQVVQRDFATTHKDKNHYPINGKNVIFTMEGKNWGTAEDRPIVLGTHYDSVNTSSAVDDNGSGMAAILEVAKALAEDGRTRNHTVIVAAFDFEEYGYTGSEDFVNDYLTTEIIKQYNIPIGNFQGAVILDTMMNYDSTNNSQNFPAVFNQAYPAQIQTLTERGLRGDFMTIIGRKSDDEKLQTLVSDTWLDVGNPEQDGFYYLTLEVPEEGKPSTWPTQILDNLGHLLRSDHAEFWNYQNTPNGLPAVWITDTAEFRGFMKDCYHQMCDNLENSLKPDNLKFLLKTTNTLYRALNQAAEASEPQPSSAVMVSVHYCTAIVIILCTVLTKQNIFS